MAKRAPIGTFSELYQHAVAERQWLGPFLSGHLTVEFMLRELAIQIDPDEKSNISKLKQFGLIHRNSSLETISEAQRDVLLSINKMRNRIAHEIDYNPTIEDMKGIWRDAAAAFSDFGGGISLGLMEMDVEGQLNTLDDWVFTECFMEIVHDLHQALIDLGGDEKLTRDAQMNQTR